MATYQKEISIEEKPKNHISKFVHISKQPFIKAARIIKPKNTFEWVLLAVAVPVPLGVVLWVLIKTSLYKQQKPDNLEPLFIEAHNEEMAA